jgi:hypothetical protein
MTIGWRHVIYDRMLPVIGLLAILGSPLPALAQATSEPKATIEPVPSVVVDTNYTFKEEQLREREEVGRLRSARKEEASRRAEAARKLEVDRVRLHVLTRLQAGVSSLGQRESYLHHEVRSMQHELHTVSRDPADHSAMVRRGDLERQLTHLQNELSHATTSKQSAVRQFDELRLR